jgi:ribosome-binding factor A
MAAKKRAEQVGDLIRAELAGLIQRDLRDPRVGFVTLTAVRLSPDLRSARVYVSVLEESREDEAIQALGRASGFLRRELAARLQLRNVPSLAFHADPSLRRGARIEELLSEEAPPEGEEP